MAPIDRDGLHSPVAFAALACAAFYPSRLGLRFPVRALMTLLCSSTLGSVLFWFAVPFELFVAVWFAVIVGLAVIARADRVGSAVRFASIATAFALAPLWVGWINWGAARRAVPIEEAWIVAAHESDRVPYYAMLAIVGALAGAFVVGRGRSLPVALLFLGFAAWLGAALVDDALSSYLATMLQRDSAELVRGAPRAAAIANATDLVGGVAAGALFGAGLVTGVLRFRSQREWLGLALVAPCLAAAMIAARESSDAYELLGARPNPRFWETVPGFEPPSDGTRGGWWWEQPPRDFELAPTSQQIERVPGATWSLVDRQGRALRYADGEWELLGPDEGIAGPVFADRRTRLGDVLRAASGTISLNATAPEFSAALAAQQRWTWIEALFGRRSSMLILSPADARDEQELCLVIARARPHPVSDCEPLDVDALEHITVQELFARPPGAIMYSPRLDTRRITPARRGDEPPARPSPTLVERNGWLLSGVALGVVASLVAFAFLVARGLLARRRLFAAARGHPSEPVPADAPLVPRWIARRDGTVAIPASLGGPYRRGLPVAGTTTTHARALLSLVARCRAGVQTVAGRALQVTLIAIALASLLATEESHLVFDFAWSLTRGFLR